MLDTRDFVVVAMKAGIPLGFMMRGLIGVKYASWYFLFETLVS